MENGKSVWELDVGQATREADGGPGGPPTEILRLLAAPLLGRELVEIARTRTRSEGDDVETALLDGQRVISLVADWQPKLPKPKKQKKVHTGAPALDRLCTYLKEQVEEIARHDPGARLGDNAGAAFINCASRPAARALLFAPPALSSTRHGSTDCAPSSSGSAESSRPRAISTFSSTGCRRTRPSSVSPEARSSANSKATAAGHRRVS